MTCFHNEDILFSLSSSNRETLFSSTLVIDYFLVDEFLVIFKLLASFIWRYLSMVFAGLITSRKQSFGSGLTSPLVPVESRTGTHGGIRPGSCAQGAAGPR